MQPDRRTFLQSLAAGAAALALPQGAMAQGVAATKLTNNLTLITGAGNNIVMLAGGDEGNLLVDCGDAAHAQDVLKIAGKVNTVINTHWHLESTGANDAMAQAGAKLASHLNTQLWMTQEIIQEFKNERKVFPKRAPQAMPTQTFRADGKLLFGGEGVEYGLLTQAHTDGDIFVHFPLANVIVVGDAVQPGRLPDLDWFCGGWIGGMANAQQAILKRANDATKIVPARGPVMTKAEMQASSDLVGKMREKLVGLVKKGKGAQNMIDEKAVDEFKLAGDPEKFLFAAYRGLWSHARELGGVV